MYTGVYFFGHSVLPVANLMALFRKYSRVTDRRTDKADHYYSWPHFVATRLLTILLLKTIIAL